MNREPLTDTHRQKLAEIATAKKEQDEILGKMSTNLDGLHAVAIDIGDELTLQNNMIAGLDHSIDRAQGQMDSSNNAITRLQNNIRSRPICCYLVCIALLLIVFVVLIYYILNDK